MRLRILTACVLALGACASADIPKPTEADVLRAAQEKPTTSLADLERGRSLYLGRCTACHQPVEPRKFAPADWPKHVIEMKQRSKLTDDDTSVMIRYLAAVAGRPRS